MSTVFDSVPGSVFNVSQVLPAYLINERRYLRGTVSCVCGGGWGFGSVLRANESYAQKGTRSRWAGGLRKRGLV